jgi:RNA 3'-terminal phosphate cyclase (ATP)
MLRIDGSRGEGGGQVLRSSLALSMASGRPFRIENIRARRAKPGLQRQHLTAVLAAAEVSGAVVDGASVGSRALSFAPGPVRPGSYHFAIGTAGSAPLVFQTVLPALMLAGAPSELIFEGGTHNPMAPPVDFLARVFLPLVRRLGPEVELEVDRLGFYPAGGGRFRARIVPRRDLGRLELLEAPRVSARRARALVAGLPPHIAERELRVVREALRWSEEECGVESGRAASPGNALFLELEAAPCGELVTAIGERGVPAERVAAAAVAEMRAFLDAGVPVGAHLADQLLLPLALGGGGVFRTVPLSEHTRTNLEVIHDFGAARIAVREEVGAATLEVGAVEAGFLR